MNDSVNTRFLKSATQGIEYTRGVVGFTTASCLSSSCTYWNVCFILSSTSLSLSPCRFCWRICWVFTKSACFFRSSRRPIVILSLHTPISIHHFASGRLRGLGPTLPDYLGKARLIQGIELRQRARHEPHDGGLHLGRRPE